jgi:hypothetical protein
MSRAALNSDTIGLAGSYLDVHSLLSASEVCKAWRVLLNDPFAHPWRVLLNDGVHSEVLALMAKVKNLRYFLFALSPQLLKIK